MPSATHALFLRAMREKRQVTCLYQGHPRELCPIILGRTGIEEKALVFQFGGSTSQGPIPAPGEWKCLKLAESRKCCPAGGQMARRNRAFGSPELHENGRIRRKSKKPLQPGLPALAQLGSIP